MTAVAIDGFPGETERLDLMHEVFDPITWQHLERLGPLHGRHVLDAGAGRGRVAKALWERIGPNGRLLAVDLKEAHLADHGDVRYERRVLNLEQAAELPDTFDLVFSRMVLDHVAGRDEAVAQLATLVRPGGTLFLQDLDIRPAMGPDVPADYARLVDAYHRWCVGNGYDYRWISTVPALMERCGLAEVQVVSQTIWFRGGSAFARMFGATLAVHRDQMADWMDPAEIEAAYHWMQAPTTGWVPGSALWSVWGRRP